VRTRLPVRSPSGGAAGSAGSIRMLWVILLLALFTLARITSSDPGDGSGAASAALAVSIGEMPDTVRLHIQASGDVDARSIEVRFAGRKMVVLARDAAGRAIRSEPLRLPEPVVEEGASAEFDAEGAIVMTLRKEATAPPPTGEPGAAIR
jgi:hypothetical protein